MEDNTHHNSVMGVVIHCDHEFRRPYGPPSKQVKKSLTIRFNTRCYKSVVYLNNGIPLVSTQPQPCSPLNIYTRSRNPHCKHCFFETIDFLVERNYSLHDAIDEIFRFFDVAERKVRSMLRGYDELNNDNEQYCSLKFNEVFNYEAPINLGYRLCVEEEYRGLVANGVAFERLLVLLIPANTVISRLLVIKGLEMVNNNTDVQELLAKEDNVCAICLDGFSTKVDKDDDEEKEDDPTVQEKAVTTIDDDDNKTKDHKLIVRLPCKHVFHEGCITKWVREHHICPCCRFQLPVMINK